MYAMYHKGEPRAVLTAIVITIVALGTFAFVVFTKLQSVVTETGTNDLVAADVAGWDVYQNDTYGFRLEYPPEWAMDTSDLMGGTPFVVFGNPLSGKSTYTLQVFVENNNSSLSSGEYVHALLNADLAHDGASGAGAGHAPATTPQYEKAEVLSVGASPAYEAYELYGVFEFDHIAERIYVAHGDEVLRFDFPVARETHTISLPVANNAVAHYIVNTLTFTK